MTKGEFIDKVADKSKLSKRDAAAAVDAFLATVEETLKSGDSVSFTGFGKFSAQQRAARMGVNPRTGEKVQIAAARVPKFSAGSALKSAVRSLLGAAPGHGRARAGRLCSVRHRCRRTLSPLDVRHRAAGAGRPFFRRAAHAVRTYVRIESERCCSPSRPATGSFGRLPPGARFPPTRRRAAARASGPGARESPPRCSTGCSRRTEG